MAPKTNIDTFGLIFVYKNSIIFGSITLKKNWNVLTD
jgi:hypothetical protein